MITESDILESLAQLDSKFKSIDEALIDTHTAYKEGKDSFDDYAEHNNHFGKRISANVGRVKVQDLALKITRRTTPAK
jgi:hypothetical protein